MAPSKPLYVDAGQTSRKLLDLDPDTPYVVSMRARTGAGYGPVVTTDDRTLEMSGMRRSRLLLRCERDADYTRILKAKFHYAIGFEPASNQLRIR